MNIGGFTKQSLIDYPGRIACIIFTKGCTLQCPFCHNPGLVNGSTPDISEETVFSHLQKNQKLLDGVVITGGEPTLHKDLPRFLRQIKERGLSVKLDTNGTNPAMLDKIINEGLVDYLAMDIKAPLTLTSYQKLCGKKLNANDLDSIKESIIAIKQSGLPHEFRTTVIKELHTKEDILAMAELTKGSTYYLQRFKNTTTLDPTFKLYTSYSKEELAEMTKGLGVKVR
jgi:pyruvate formate lyase activating enzyme